MQVSTNWCNHRTSSRTSGFPFSLLAKYIHAIAKVQCTSATDLQGWGASRGGGQEPLVLRDARAHAPVVRRKQLLAHGQTLVVIIDSALEVPWTIGGAGAQYALARSTRTHPPVSMLRSPSREYTFASAAWLSFTASEISRVLAGLHGGNAPESALACCRLPWRPPASPMKLQGLRRHPLQLLRRQRVHGRDE